MTNIKTDEKSLRGAPRASTWSSLPSCCASSARRCCSTGNPNPSHLTNIIIPQRTGAAGGTCGHGGFTRESDVVMTDDYWSRAEYIIYNHVSRCALSFRSTSTKPNPSHLTNIIILMLRARSLPGAPVNFTIHPC